MIDGIEKSVIDVIESVGELIHCLMDQILRLEAQNVEILKRLDSISVRGEMRPINEFCEPVNRELPEGLIK